MKTEIFTRNLSGLNRLWRVPVCRYWPVCPMRAELQNTRAYNYGKPDRRPSGQPTIRNPGVEADRDSGVEGEPDNPDGKPP